MHIYATVAIVSYLLGSIPFGYLLVRLFLKTDVRTLGSGNIGATNVGRTGHRGLAIATLLLDAGKGAVAVILARLVFDSTVFISGVAYDLPGTLARERFLAASLAALFAVCGHVFPIWLKFRGGKGVATAVGSFAILAPGAVLVALVVFLVALAVTQYVSLGSILGCITFPIAAYILTPVELTHRLVSPDVLAIMGFTSVLVILKHHQNIRRLIAGTENKLGAKVAPTDPIQTEKNA